MNQDQDQERGPTLVNLLGPSCTVVGLGLSAAGVFFPEQRTGLMMLGLLLVVAGLMLFFIDARSLQSGSPLDSTSLGTRWWGGLVTLVGCWGIVWWLLSLFGKPVEVVFEVTRDSMEWRTMRWGAFVILGPIILSAFKQERTSGPWAFWRRGFEMLLLCCLAILPGFILHQATVWMRHSGMVEQVFLGETGLILFALGGHFGLMPFWIMFLRNLLAGTRLAGYTGWPLERVSEG